MRRILAVLAVCLVVCGCSSESDQITQALELRNSLLGTNGCSFDATVTADYGDKLYTFTMTCEINTEGKMQFTVVQPESISGITGTVSGTGGELTFDDSVLAFETIADGQITPVSAPWLFINALRSGYIKGCGKTSEGLYIQIDDSYREDALQVDIWTDGSGCPMQAEILWKGKRIMSIEVDNFKLL